MGDYPSYDSAKALLKDLRKQGFITEETSDGWLVSSPHNSETTVIHESKGHSWSNAKIADLKRMGFQPPSLRYPCPTCGQRFSAPVKVAMHRSKEHGLRFKCPECDDEFETPQAMGRHKKNVHVTTLAEAREQLEKASEAPEGPTGDESEPAITEHPPHEPEPLRDRRTRAGKVVTRHVDENVQEMTEAADDLKAAADRMLDAHRELYKRYADLKKRQDRIEDRLGKVIQDL